MKEIEKLIHGQPRLTRACLSAVAFLLACIAIRVFAQNSEQIAEEALAATVSLEMKDIKGTVLGFGSGFFVQEDLIATNFHVIEGATKGTAKLVNKLTHYSIEGVLATDKDNDLALLKVSGHGTKPLPLGDSDDIKIGATVYVAGNPRGLEGTFSIGIISSRRDRDTKERLQMTAPISPGSSGGPVLNQKGEVVGISYMTIKGGQNLNFAIPSNYLKKLLTQSGTAQSFPQMGEMSVAKAKEIVAAAVEAHGGLEKLQAVKNAVMEADISANSQAGLMQIDTKLYYHFPDKFRQEMKTPQGEVAYVYDGSAAYVMTPMGVQPIPPQMAASFKDSIFRETVWLLTSLSQNDIPIQYVGTEDVQGKPASILLIPQPSGEMLRLFISDETHYVVKYTYRETAQGVTANREAFMDDYRDVDGIKIAYHIVQNVEGQLFSESRVKRVTLNAELDASLFQEPE